MSITEQIKTLRQIQRYLKIDLRDAGDDNEWKAEVNQQLEGLRWAIDTLSNTEQVLSGLEWLKGLK